MCNAKFEPILAHGNGYHREECEHYDDSDIVNYSPQNCFECKMANRICANPKKLEKMDIPTSEKPKINY